jgi:adenylate kinase
VGKGTQAERLAEWLAVPHVATGDLFREALKKGTELGKLAQSYMEQGKLVPDDLTVAMVREHLAKPDYDNGAILDGFPRTVEQARRFDKALGEDGSSISTVIYLRASDETLLDRLSGRWTCRECQKIYHEKDLPGDSKVCDSCGGELYQRPDDNRETIEKRLTVYGRETAPLVDYYRERGLLMEIDAEGDIESIQTALREAVTLR